MQYVQVGGLTSVYHKVGKGPMLILLHGWANTWEAWLPIVPQLSDRFTLIIPDLPGFGGSEGPTEGWSTADYAQWLGGFIAKVQSRHPSKKIFLAGHSYGGKIAAYLASHDFPQPDKLVLIDSSGIPNRLTRKQLVLRLMSRAAPPFLKQTLKETIRTKLYKTFDADSDYLNASGPQRNTLKKVLTENLTSDLPHISQPTLIVWGETDPATPISSGKIFHQLIPGSHLKVFDAEHFPHHQHPDEVATEIIKFLEAKVDTKAREQGGRVKGQDLPPTTGHQSLATQLAILQQAEYEWPRFQDWLANQTGESQIEPKKWTRKLKTMRTLITLTRPLIGEHLSLWFWNASLKMPQYLFFLLVIKLATWKLRFLQIRGLTVIAIAGSYAKTSTKYIMHHVLSAQVPTLMTPENINTPYGIARVVLNSLNFGHKIFLAELGEYYPGDIAALTRFLNPKLKVLTPVGYAHLERFGTEERLEKGLLELATTNPTVMTFSDEKNQDLFTKHAVNANVTLYGESNITDISVTRAGTEFTALLPEPTTIFIPLLGKHNAINVLPSLLAVERLGLGLDNALGRLKTIPHIPHRLEPTLLERNIFLLDNGYNSNPGSAREALAVLKEIPGSQKIVITPGFVEMGTEQESSNIELGKQLAAVCDFVGIVTGANETALITGLTQAKFDKKKILTGESELEIMNNLQGIIQSDAVILFENSLTEVYKKMI